MPESRGFTAHLVNSVTTLMYSFSKSQFSQHHIINSANITPSKILNLCLFIRKLAYCLILLRRDTMDNKKMQRFDNKDWQRIKPFIRKDLRLKSISFSLVAFTICVSVIGILDGNGVIELPQIIKNYLPTLSIILVLALFFLVILKFKLADQAKQLEKEIDEERKSLFK